MVWNRQTWIRLARQSSPSSRWWGPAKGHISLEDVQKAPAEHGLLSVKETHPCHPVRFLPPEWCTEGLVKHFESFHAHDTPDRTLLFEGSRVCGLDGIVITKADQLLEETLIQPELDYDRHPAMVSPYYGRVNRFSGALGVVASRFSNNVYHWLFDILPRFEMLKALNGSVDRYYVLADTPYQLGSLDRLGIPQKSILRAKLRVQWEPDVLVVPLIPGGLETVPAWVPHFLRDAFVETAKSRITRKLYISRSRCRTRNVMNEGELRSFLEQRGFLTVWLEDYSFKEQVSLMASAKVVVAPHGAGLAGMVFCRPGTPVIECFRCEYVNTLYFRLARLCGHPYAALVSPGNSPVSIPSGMNRRFVYEPITVSLPEMNEALKVLDC